MLMADGATFPNLGGQTALHNTGFHGWARAMLGCRSHLADGGIGRDGRLRRGLTPFGRQGMRSAQRAGALGGRRVRA